MLRSGLFEADDLGHVSVRSCRCRLYNSRHNYYSAAYEVYSVTEGTLEELQ